MSVLCPIATQILEVTTGDLWSIVYNNILRNFKPGYDIDPKKIYNMGVCYLAQGFCLHPFRELASYNLEEDLFHDVIGKFEERPRNLSVSMELVTILCSVNHVFCHRWPVISYSFALRIRP